MSRRSILVEVNHPHVDLALRCVPEGSGWWDRYEEGQLVYDQFDGTLVPFYGYPGSDRKLVPLHTPLYNKWIGKLICIRSADHPGWKPVRLRNIEVGKPAISGGLHVGGVWRFKSRIYVQNV